MSEQLITSLAVGALIMLLLAIAIISFVVYYQRRLIQGQIEKQKLKVEAQDRMLAATIQTQETERKRIAKDLHDEIGALLAAIRLGVIQIGSDETTGKFGVEKAQESKTLIEEAIKNVRRISQDLMPATLEKFGLAAALLELCQKLEKASGVRMDFKGEEGDIPLKAQSGLALYRIVQELINNTLKHAKATKIIISLQKTNALLYLTVADNGSGFDLEYAQGQSKGVRGLGLSNIESRVNMLNAKILYETAPGEGTRVTIEAPMEPNRDKTLAAVHSSP